MKFYAGRVPFEFLEDIHQRFVKTYGRAIHTASPYAMNEDFSRIMSQQMDHYSNDSNADRLNRLQGEMSHVCLIAYLCQMVFDHFEKFRLTHCWAWDGILSAGKEILETEKTRLLCDRHALHLSTMRTSNLQITRIQ